MRHVWFIFDIIVTVTELQIVSFFVKTFLASSGSVQQFLTSRKARDILCGLFPQAMTKVVFYTATDRCLRVLNTPGVWNVNFPFWAIHGSIVSRVSAHLGGTTSHPWLASICPHDWYPKRFQLKNDSRSCPQRPLYCHCKNLKMDYIIVQIFYMYANFCLNSIH